MRLILYPGVTVLALVVGFAPVLLNDESRATDGGASSNASGTAEDRSLNEERRRADELDWALAAAKQELAALKEQARSLQQEHQRVVNLAAKLAQELALVRQDLDTAKQQRHRDPASTL